MHTNCLFCHIANKKITSTIIFENKNILIFKDLYPQASIHYLAIEKRHSDNIIELFLSKNYDLWDGLKNFFETKEGRELSQKGVRFIANSGEEAGQTIFHTHLHLLSGKLPTGLIPTELR